MDGFFEELSPTKVQPSRNANALATRLRDTLADKGLLKTRTISIKSWSHQFDLLLQTESLQHVRNVLKWFLENIKGQYTPKVYSAKTFRTKFPQLNNCMKRNLQQVQAETTKVSKEVLKLQKEMGLIWPMGEVEKKLEAMTIQVSFDRMVKFKERLQFRAKSLSGRIDITKAGGNEWLLWKTLHAVIDNIGDPFLFTEGWIRWVHSVAWKWDKWKGHLDKWAFLPQSSRFQELLVLWIRDYSGNTITVDTILEN